MKEPWSRTKQRCKGEGAMVKDMSNFHLAASQSKGAVLKENPQRKVGIEACRTL